MIKNKKILFVIVFLISLLIGVKDTKAYYYSKDIGCPITIDANPYNNDLTSLDFYETIFDFALSSDIKYYSSGSCISMDRSSFLNQSSDFDVTDFEEYSIAAGVVYPFYTGSSYDSNYYTFNVIFTHVPNFYSYNGGSYNGIGYNGNSPTINISFRFNKSTQEFYVGSVRYIYSPFTSNTNNMGFLAVPNPNYVEVYTTEDIDFTSLSPTPSYTNLHTIGNSDIVFDEDLLVGDTRFKTACVNGLNTSFSVIPTDLSNIDTSQNSSVTNYFLSNYILRDYDINLLTFGTVGVDNYHIGQVAPAFYQYDFNTLISLTDFTSSSLYSGFNTLYPNLYKSLYGWGLYNSSFVYNSTDNIFMFPVYRLNNSYKLNVFCYYVGGSTVCIDSEGNTHGGGGREPGSDIVVKPNEDFCFYIPTDYSIKVWNTDSFNDIDDSITINNTDYTITTDSYQQAALGGINNSTYSGYIGYFKYVMQTLSIPLAFISSKLTKLFNILPLPLQYLIIGIVALGFLIGLIKFLTGGK